jgi:nucleoid-associated protein YgaU
MEESRLLLKRVKSAGVEQYFPAQFHDLVLTFDKGEDLYLKGEVTAAENYFRFAINKATMLESAFVDEVKSREDAARLAAELQARAEMERELKKKQDLERAQAAAAAAAREAEAAREAARKAEAEHAEARRRAERARYEREHSLASRHTVKRGETLPQIAALPEVYGDSSLWPLLYRANRDQIRDPKVLWPGQQLRIPRNLDKNDLNEARRFSSERSAR